MKVKGAAKVSGTPQTLGARIRIVRKAWGWTQEDLAQALNTDRQIVSYWERDKSKPSRPAMQLLAGLFQLPVDALIDGNGFSIPDLPQSSEDNQGGALLGLLPQAKDGKVSVVYADSEMTKHISFEQARKRLSQAEADGHSVWIVISVG